MGLIDRINAIFRRTRGEERTTSAETLRLSESFEEVAQKFSAETERARVVEACRLMYSQDPRARKMLRTLARDMTKGGFTVKCREERAAQVAQALYKRLDLDKVLDDWVRLTARDGDSFLEVVINERLEIVDISRKPTLRVRRNSNAMDRFDDPTKGYWMGSQLHIGAEPPKDAVWFADWQMIHARWEHDEGSRYGTPMLASGISAWRKVNEGELDVAVRRKTRASMRYLHVLENASEAEIERYKEKNKSALSASAAVADFFSNRPGSISVIQGDARLNEIEDVRHHIQTWMASGEMPMELLVYGEELNRDVLNKKLDEYRETLEQLRVWVVSELIRPLLERQWLLAGILPEGLDYDITWKAQAAVTPREILDVADAAMRLRLLGFPEEMVWNVLSRFLPGIDSEMISQAIQAREGGGDDAGRMDAILGGIMRGLQ
jgi:hypothetical protein